MSPFSWALWAIVLILQVTLVVLFIRALKADNKFARFSKREGEQLRTFLLNYEAISSFGALFNQEEVIGLTKVLSAFKTKVLTLDTISVHEIAVLKMFVELHDQQQKAQAPDFANMSSEKIVEHVDDGQQAEASVAHAEEVAEHIHEETSAKTEVVDGIPMVDTQEVTA